jgi:glycosyltransferase involved in cell wall biosynthesis
MNLRILVNAGPWLPVPPDGYGGVENVVATLVPELRRRGVYVVLATIGRSRIVADEVFSVYGEPQFGQLLRPHNRVMGVAVAHMKRVVDELRSRDDLDLVHDHLEVVGPAMLSVLGNSGPPALHTLHWDLAKHPDFYRAFAGQGRLHVNGVSTAQLARAPEALRAHSLGSVHLATPLAEMADRRAGPDKTDYVVVLGRITPAKGQHIAARVARGAGVDVLLAGPVGPYHTPNALERALANDPEAAINPDVRYWCDQVRRYVDGDRVRWIGSVGATERDELVMRARATVFPLCWEEPGGTAAIESLALGTPVVGYRRGCLPELIDEGNTGLLFTPGDEDGLRLGLTQARNLSSATCRRAAAARFTPSVMAERYVDLYEAVVAGSPGHHAGGPVTIADLSA